MQYIRVRGKLNHVSEVDAAHAWGSSTSLSPRTYRVKPVRSAAGTQTHDMDVHDWRRERAARRTLPYCSKYALTSSTVVVAERPPTKIFFVFDICKPRE